MRVLVTGASGLVGSALVARLRGAGNEVVRAVRRRPAPGEVHWDPVEGQMEPSALTGVDAVVHLAGEGIADARWTPDVKRRIRASRVDGSGLVARTIARATAMAAGPRVLVQASAVGFYGDRGDEVLDEGAPRGTGFLAEVCEAWEAAAAPARDAGVRVVLLRTGVVLAEDGGALAKMLPPFRRGVGGVLGSGRQWMPWITLDDEVEAVLHCLANGDVAGPVNAVAPEPATNAQFTRALGRVLRRPTLFRVPAAAARLAFGEMADELLLASTRAVPGRLRATGFTWRHAELEGALRHVLGR